MGNPGKMIAGCQFYLLFVVGTGACPSVFDCGGMAPPQMQPCPAS